MSPSSWNTGVLSRLPQQPLAFHRPSNLESLDALLDDAIAHDHWVCPIGGGHHLRPQAVVQKEIVVADLRSLTKLLDVQPQSLVLQVEAGISWGGFRALAAEHEMEVEHLGSPPDSATLGGLLARYWPWPPAYLQPGLRGACVGLSARYGPDREYRYLQAPRKASGPDLRGLFIGAQGRHGLITSVSIALRRAPEARRAVVFELGSLVDAVSLARTLLRADLRPTTMTALGSTTGATLTLVFSGVAAIVDGWVLRAQQRGAASVEASERAPIDAVFEAVGHYDTLLAAAALVLEPGSALTFDGFTPFGARVCAAAHEPSLEALGWTFVTEPVQTSLPSDSEALQRLAAELTDAPWSPTVTQ